MGYINRNTERHLVPRSDILLTDSLTHAIGRGVHRCGCSCMDVCVSVWLLGDWRLTVSDLSWERQQTSLQILVLIASRAASHLSTSSQHEAPAPQGLRSCPAAKGHPHLALGSSLRADEGWLSRQHPNINLAWNKHISAYTHTHTDACTLWKLF